MSEQIKAPFGCKKRFRFSGDSLESLPNALKRETFHLESPETFLIFNTTRRITQNGVSPVSRITQVIFLQEFESRISAKRFQKIEGDSPEKRFQGESETETFLGESGAMPNEP